MLASGSLGISAGPGPVLIALYRSRPVLPPGAQGRVGALWGGVWVPCLRRSVAQGRRMLCRTDHQRGGGGAGTGCVCRGLLPPGSPHPFLEESGVEEWELLGALHGAGGPFPALLFGLGQV